MSLQDTPIVRVTADGIETTAGHHDLDVIVYATGFDAITGAFDRSTSGGSMGRRSPTSGQMALAQRSA